MNEKMSKLDWTIAQNRQETAGKQADAIVARLGLTAPINPLKVAESEESLLRVGGRDFRDRFDGKLEYHPGKNCFLLFYNTKYDAGLPPGKHHPRTHFSISHELGHYFLDHHHAYLVNGGKPHSSSSEFRTDVQIEREADSFAASLLLPTHLVDPLVGAAELSLDRLENIAGRFEVSLVSTAIRCVRLSDLPCAVAGIRGGRIGWMFPSEALIKGGCYPGGAALRSPSARDQWQQFRAGVSNRIAVDGESGHWFNTYDRDELYELCVSEQYVPVRSMNTLLVVLTMNEDDFSPDDEDGDGSDD